MRKTIKIVLILFLFLSCTSPLFAENEVEGINPDSNDIQINDFAPDFLVLPLISIYGGYPEYFSFDLGGDFLFPSILGFSSAYGFYAMGGLGNGSDITNIRVSTGLSAQNDYVGLKLGIGGDFSFLSTVPHDPFFFTEAILRLWIFEFKVIYDCNVPIFFTDSSEPSYKQNPKFYLGINLIMCIANIFGSSM